MIRPETARTAEEYDALIDTLRDFINEEVIPREDLRAVHDRVAIARVTEELQSLALARGLGAPRGRREEGGLALSWEQCCAYLEQAGRSFLGPLALRCGPPIQPDIFALESLANPAQKERYLMPLVRGTRILLCHDRAGAWRGL